MQEDYSEDSTTRTQTQPTDLLEDIFNYLKLTHQENDHEEEGFPVPKDVEIPGLEKPLFYRGEWDKNMKDHNQYELFDLSKILEDFEIDDAKMEKLTFREHLIISSFLEDPNSTVPIPVGGLCVDIQRAVGKEPEHRRNPILSSTLKPRSDSESDDQVYDTITAPFSKSESSQSFLEELTGVECKFLIHVSSQLEVEENNGGSRITSWVDRNFHTIEERRYEYINDADAPKGMHEKILYCGMQRGCYYIHHRCNKTPLVDNKYYSMRKMRDFLSEGANFLIMRYLAITRYFGEFEMSTLYLNGDPCRNIYRCTGPEGGIVNDQKLDLCRIYRRVVEECGIEHKSITVLSLAGQILKQEWMNCPYVLHVNPLAKLSNEKPTGNEHLLLEKTWEKDMELYSRYLDRKENGRNRMATYLLDNTELKDIMFDYVRTILLMKPTDVLDYTIDHFQNFSPQYIPQNMPHLEYFEGDQTTDDSLTKLDSHINI